MTSIILTIAHGAVFDFGGVLVIVTACPFLFFSEAGSSPKAIRRCSACRLADHRADVCPLVLKGVYPCECGQDTCKTCMVSCETCHERGHTCDMQVSKIPDKSGKAAVFVCLQHSVSDMQSRVLEDMAKRPPTARQKKLKRAAGKKALAEAPGGPVPSTLAMHVAQATIVDEWGLGGAAAQPRARRADAAIAAAKDAGASVGGARIAGAMAADRSMHGGWDVSAPPVGIMSAGSTAGSTVEEARAAALATFDGAFRALQQPKYSPAKRKSMKDVLGEVKMRATRMGANTEIYGSCNYFSGRTGMQLRTAGMRFANISTGELAAQVRLTFKAFFDEPYYFSGSSLTAETVTTEALMEILTTCASEAKLTNIAALTAVKQYILELRRSNEGLSVYFSKVCLLGRRCGNTCVSRCLPRARSRLHGFPNSTGCRLFASHLQRRVVLNDPDHSRRGTKNALTRRT